MKTGGQISREEVTSTRRAEHRYTELQPIRKDFYPSTADLIKSTRAGRDNSRGVDDFALTRFAENLNRIQASASDILSVRLIKISRLAVLNAFQGDVEVENMTSEERVFFERVKALAKDMKDEFERSCGMKTYSSQKLEAFTETDVPQTAPGIPNVPAEEVQPAQAEAAFDDPDFMDGVIADEEPVIDEDEEFAPPEPDLPPETPVGDTRLRLVRMVNDAPPLCGFDDRVYNLHREDIVYLPDQLARMLISAHQAVEVRPS